MTTMLSIKHSSILISVSKNFFGESVRGFFYKINENNMLEGVKFDISNIHAHDRSICCFVTTTMTGYDSFMGPKMRY